MHKLLWHGVYDERVLDLGCGIQLGFRVGADYALPTGGTDDGTHDASS